jgi:hypothetical protein
MSINFGVQILEAPATAERPAEAAMQLHETLVVYLLRLSGPVEIDNVEGLRFRVDEKSLWLYGAGGRSHEVVGFPDDTLAQLASQADVPVQAIDDRGQAVGYLAALQILDVLS